MVRHNTIKVLPLSNQTKLTLTVTLTLTNTVSLTQTLRTLLTHTKRLFGIYKRNFALRCVAGFVCVAKFGISTVDAKMSLMLKID